MHISQHNITGQFMVIAALIIASVIRPMITNIALVLSDIRVMLLGGHTKKEGSTWLPVWAREAWTLKVHVFPSLLALFAQFVGT